ncbi:MAG: DNA-binding Lrp family transcriptional regulator [Candidatus Nitrosomirales archaeon]|jgi:DNA-binding Lrp family transcriptional regulator
MPKALVLMNAELGHETTLVNELKKTSNVTEVYAVYGVYDVIVKVEAESMEKLREAIATKLRRISGIKSTLTMIIVEG